MEHSPGESDGDTIAVEFDCRLKFEFYGVRIASDAGTLAYCELNATRGLTDLAGAALAECRRGGGRSAERSVPGNPRYDRDAAPHSAGPMLSTCWVWRYACLAPGEVRPNTNLCPSAVHQWRSPSGTHGTGP
jgi:hypothetical protein